MEGKKLKTKLKKNKKIEQCAECDISLYIPKE